MGWATHFIEKLHMTFDEARKLGEWAPIRDCPGRFVLRGAPATLDVARLLGRDADIREFQPLKARDAVFVVRLEDGGTISYRQPAGTWVHTLCTPDGFKRKLEQLEIAFHEPSNR